MSTHKNKNPFTVSYRQTYSIECIKKELLRLFFRGGRINELVAHEYTHLTFPNKLYVLSYITVIHYGCTRSIPFHLNAKNQLVNHFIRQGS